MPMQRRLADAEGICVYCNHCQPCPKGIDVGLMNKYYDLALAGDEMAAGHCESRCPFHVKQEKWMFADFFHQHKINFEWLDPKFPLFHHKVGKQNKNGKHLPQSGILEFTDFTVL